MLGNMPGRELWQMFGRSSNNGSIIEPRCDDEVERGPELLGRFFIFGALRYLWEMCFERRHAATGS